MERKVWVCISLILVAILFLVSCQSTAQPVAAGKKTVVVTYSILGSVVNDLVGDSANVVVMMPNGADPHEWEPSAKDIETLNRADLIVQNGIELEGGMQKTLEEARGRGCENFYRVRLYNNSKSGGG